VNKEMKYLKRILALPFILGLLLIQHTWYIVSRAYGFIKHGGECILYVKEDPKIIQDIYIMLKERQDLIDKEELQ
jgi:hypothetical protein